MAKSGWQRKQFGACGALAVMAVINTRLYMQHPPRNVLKSVEIVNLG
jgi:hypothetical protein